jgi:ATP/maltotriose-dependent transcriptional regulator MalT
MLARKVGLWGLPFPKKQLVISFGTKIYRFSNMRFLVPTIEHGKVSIAIVHDRVVNEEPALGVLCDRSLMSQFMLAINESRITLNDLQDDIEAFYNAYVERVQTRVFSANGDFCPPLVDAVSLQPPLSICDQPTRFTFQTLSPREVQLSELLWEGKTSKHIASLWHRSELTVKKHKENLNQKFGRRLNPSDLATILFVSVTAGLSHT